MGRLLLLLTFCFEVFTGDDVMGEEFAAPDCCGEDAVVVGVVAVDCEDCEKKSSKARCCCEGVEAGDESSSLSSLNLVSSMIYFLFKKGTVSFRGKKKTKLRWKERKIRFFVNKRKNYKKSGSNKMEIRGREKKESNRNLDFAESKKKKRKKNIFFREAKKKERIFFRSGQALSNMMTPKKESL